MCSSDLSRNQYLNATERKIAPLLYKEMRKTATAILGGMPAGQALEQARTHLINAGFDRIDYFELRTPYDLAVTDHPDAENRIFAAAWLGQTRLIDNCPLA